MRNIAVALFAVLTIASMAYAIGGPGGMGPGGPGGMRVPGGLSGMMLIHAAEELELSKTQKQKLAGMLKVAMTENKPVREEFKAEVKNMMQAVEQGNISVTRSAFRNSSSLMENMMVERARIMKEFRQLLTTDQKAKLQAKIDRRNEQMKRGFETPEQRMERWIEENS